MKTRLPKTPSLRTVIHGKKVKADKRYGESIIRGVIAGVEAICEADGLLGIRGEPEYEFHPSRKWRFDAAWPADKVALELNGWTSHHRRGRMEEDNVKLAAAAILGWRVIYATTKQAEKFGALWVVQALSNHHEGRARE